MTLASLAAAAFALALLAAPWVGLATLALNAVAAAAAQLLPLSPRLFSDPMRHAARFHEENAHPFVSVHVLISPAQAAQRDCALRAARRISYPSFEVIALDCAGEAVTAPPGVRWLSLPGRRSTAEALNAGLEATDWRAQYIAAWDADFIPEPQLLRLAIDHLSRENVSFVQFPQSLRASTPVEAGVDLERADFLMQTAIATRTMLQIGAAPVISMAALREVGGWGEDAFAAEAELGARLLRGGWKGLFVDAPVGRLMTTPAFRTLQTERANWLRGSVQILTRDWRIFVRKSGASSLAHLLTGQGFWLAPAVTLAVGGAAVMLYESRAILSDALTLAAATIIFTSLSGAIRIAGRGLARRVTLAGIGVALLLRLSLVWTGSTAWMNQRVPHRGPLSERLARIAPLALGALALAAALWNGAPLEATAALLLVGAWAAGRWADRALK